jgi:SAM-dependent methyltransferase
MTDSREVYSDVSGGRVLDVGTGRGGFVDELIAELKDYDEIIGIDIDGDLGEGFAKRFADHPRVRFQQTDALSLPFEDDSFDTVSVAGSLHHLSDPQIGLREMMRVLRRGGHLIVVEMYRDGQSKTQQTHVMLHHWWAAIDRLADTPHRETYTRGDVIDLINALDLSELTIRDESYLDEDPKDPEQLAQLESSIDTYLDRAAGHADLLALGAELRERLRRIGLHWATVLVALGEKR